MCYILQRVEVYKYTHIKEYYGYPFRKYSTSMCLRVISLFAWHALLIWNVYMFVDAYMYLNYFACMSNTHGQHICWHTHMNTISTNVSLHVCMWSHSVHAQMLCCKNFNVKMLRSVENQEHTNIEKVDCQYIVIFFLYLSCRVHILFLQWLIYIYIYIYMGHLSNCPLYVGIIDSEVK